MAPISKYGIRYGKYVWIDYQKDAKRFWNIVSVERIQHLVWKYHHFEMMTSMSVNKINGFKCFPISKRGPFNRLTNAIIHEIFAWQNGWMTFTMLQPDSVPYQESKMAWYVQKKTRSQKRSYSNNIDIHQYQSDYKCKKLNKNLTLIFKIIWFN